MPIANLWRNRIPDNPIIRNRPVSNVHIIHAQNYSTLPFDHRLIPIIKKTFSMINFQKLYNRNGEQNVSPSKHPSFSIIIFTLRIINRSKLDISFEMSKVRLYTITRKCSNYSRTNNLEKMPINLKKCTLHYYHKMIKKKR